MPTLTSVTRFLRDSGWDPTLIRKACGSVRDRWASEDLACGLRRDLTVAHTAPKALLDITIRPLTERDVPYILETDRGNLPPEERWERLVRRRILEAGFGTPFVAATTDDEPAYVQWMFTAEDNAEVRRHFAGTFPMLDADTVLLEGAFTPTAHRGKRIMSAAMSQIAELGVQRGARYAITFVGVDNEPSLKGCARAGFSPHLNCVQRWRRLRQEVEFTPLPVPVETYVASHVPLPRTVERAPARSDR